MESLIQDVARRLAAIDGIVAVVLGGSRARGTAHAESDIDLGIYYHPDRPLDVDALRALARELDTSQTATVTVPGEWGPWINGGAWLQIEGQHVDWLYRDLELVTRTIAQCRAGRHTCDYQPGHPHGFHNHMYMAEVHHCRVLHDPSGALALLKAQTITYPPLLRRVVIERHLFEADFSLMIARKATARADASYVAGCLFRCVACLVQALFALNERYFMNEKGSVALSETFPQRPPDFVRTINAVMAQPGSTAEALTTSVVRLGALVAACQELCAAALRDLPPLPARLRTPRRTSRRR
ncbi:MAG: nucleotidyltransferase domain-containing protein [Deltaproteobacteria bacterium]|nr:nucleotidyltransferase domain-containing protein [Deltaproteobacteria bacterium]MBI3386446.1 nucleotidyltransferase domain-containing protein [Deltaproteobacteria bacterium]